MIAKIRIAVRIFLQAQLISFSQNCASANEIEVMSSIDRLSLTKTVSVYIPEIPLRIPAMILESETLGSSSKSAQSRQRCTFVALSIPCSNSRYLWERERSDLAINAGRAMRIAQASSNSPSPFHIQLSSIKRLNISASDTITHTYNVEMEVQKHKNSVEISSSDTTHFCPASALRLFNDSHTSTLRNGLSYLPSAARWEIFHKHAMRRLYGRTISANSQL